ncbi:hypothetical protein ACFV2D_17685 [Streptomyces capillispiralis]|uniref:hypothetical protein n=1 Tax=Streptomyces capillispiralis TaxID=68182 RepID=UPI0036787ABD
MFAEVPDGVRHFDRRSARSLALEDLLGLRDGDDAGEPAAAEVGIGTARDTASDVVRDVEAALLQNERDVLDTALGPCLGAGFGAGFGADLLDEVGLSEGEVHGHQVPPDVLGRVLAQAL